jgi:hypothetical protein
MMLQRNESYETARLIQVLEDEPRMPFLDAVRAYADTEDSNRKVRLVETIIRTSRTLTGDPGIMPEEIQDALATLMERYKCFGPVNMGYAPKTYGEARNMIAACFF